jgi:hypothetical protein
MELFNQASFGEERDANLPPSALANSPTFKWPRYIHNVNQKLVFGYAGIPAFLSAKKLPSSQ